MNWKTWSLLVVALVAGFGAAYCIKSIFFVERAQQIDQVAEISGLKEQLLVANGDLASGSELSALNVRLTLTPEERVPRDGIFSFNGVAGRRISRDLKDGEPITLYDLEESEQTVDEPEGFIPPGCIVVPIQISSATKENGNRNYLQTTKLNKMIKPDDVVDIIVVKEAPSKSGPVALPRLVTETVAQDVHVFDVTDENRFSSEGAYRVSVISALLTTEQLERVRKAQEEGKIRVFLRGNGGTESFVEGGFNFFDSQTLGNRSISNSFQHVIQSEGSALDSTEVPVISNDFEVMLSNSTSTSTHMNEDDDEVDDFVDGSSIEVLDDRAELTEDLVSDNVGFEIGLAPSVSSDSDERVADDSDLGSSGFKNDSLSPSSINGEEVVTDLQPTTEDVLETERGGFRPRNSIGFDERTLGPTSSAGRAALGNLPHRPSVDDVEEHRSDVVNDFDSFSDEKELVSNGESNHRTTETRSPSSSNVKVVSPFRTVVKKQTN